MLQWHGRDGGENKKHYGTMEGSRMGKSRTVQCIMTISIGQGFRNRNEAKKKCKDELME